MSTTLLALACGSVAAEEAEPEVIVVSAERLPRAQSETVQPVDLITADDLRSYAYPYQATDPITALPGVYLLQNGGISGLSSLRLRGAPGYGTLVLFDGVPLHDAAGPQMAPDLSVLNSAGIAATEVLRGPQSGLYGSRAIGGVVDFRPLRPSDEHHGLGRLQAGSFTTIDALVQATGPVGERGGYAVGGSGTVSDGVSNGTSDPNGDPLDHEDDAFERYGVYGRFEWRLRDELSLHASLDRMQAETDFDGFNDPDAEDLFTEQVVTRLHTGARFGQADEGRLQVAADLALTIYDREQPNASFGGTAWTGTEVFASLHGRYQVLPLLSFASGVDLRQSEADTELVGGGSSLDGVSAEHVGWWLRSELAKDWWTLAGTLRLSEHSEEGDATTWQLQGAVDLLEKRVRLHAMAGTAFRAPSLYEAFSADDFGSGPIGNDQLKAEKSFGAAIGHRTWLAESVVLSNTWFRTSFDQRIDFDFASGYVNTEVKERIDGIETELRLVASDELPVEIRISHTWQDFDHAHGLERRLPANLLRAGFTWHAPHEVRAGIVFTAVDDRDDGGVTLAAYTLVDLAVSWRIDETWEVFGRGENLTDEHYQMADGFATPGIAGYLGAQGRW